MVVAEHRTIAGVTNPRPSQRIRRLAVAAWMGVIFFLSSRSKLPRPPGASLDVQSVAGHLVVYAVLAALVAWALRDSGRPLRWVLAVAWAAAVLYGVTDEIHQSFVPHRHPDPLDVLTDGFGAAASLATVWWSSGRSERRGPSGGGDPTRGDPTV